MSDKPKQEQPVAFGASSTVEHEASRRRTRAARQKLGVRNVFFRGQEHFVVVGRSFENAGDLSPEGCEQAATIAMSKLGLHRVEAFRAKRVLAS
jgi:hypothetical protein